MRPDHLAALRRFNRVVTERIGALDEEYLARSRSLGASRLLWEIGEEGTDARSLRARLGLDSGYLSRLVRSLESDGLVEVDPDPNDRRVRAIRLTRSGRAERSELDAQSDALAASLLEPLDERQRSRLVEAVTTVEQLFTAGLVRIDVADPAEPDARFCIDRYFEELDERFEGGFDPELTLPAEATEAAAPAGLLLVARLRDEPVGCGALKLHDGKPAEIKRLWVSRSVRGLGLGRRLLTDLEERARALGATAVRLDTNASLTEAISLYRSAGYADIDAFNTEPFAHHWFEKQLR